MKYLKGKKVAEDILSEIKKEISKKKIRPGLAVVLIGKNPASEIYVKLKKQRSEETGISFRLFRFGEQAEEKEILKIIKNLNEDKRINGIIVQLPLPKKFHVSKIINSVSPEKDVDGFHPNNKKLFFSGKEKFFPVFPKAIVELIKSGKKNISGRRALIIANSHTFGKVMRLALEREKVKAEYIISNDLEKNSKKIKEADILVTAVGRNGMIKNGMIKKGAIIVDGGISKKDKRVLGDVDVESIKNVSGYLSPVPGGVGPVTIACLLRNVLLASKSQKY